ncbi:MAG TPA: S8 family serine peptidase, partial [Gaiellaceae bacterium]|nr:S8 family serine peptidase [Gaiellaceae bacterium]
MQHARPARRSLLTALAASMLAALLAVANGAAAGGKPAAVAEAKPKVKADRNGNKVFDDLEARLATLGGGERASVIVTLDAPATETRVTGLERAVGAFSVSHRFRVVDGFTAALTKGQVNALARRGEVVSVEENSRVRALNDGAQASFGVTKARADAPGLDGDADGNAATYSPADLVAAVIDTGIDAGHQDLDEGKVLAFKDFVNGRTDPYDDEGHGTHVAATIAGDGDARADDLHEGVAPAAGLVGAKVLDANGGGTMAGVTAAIDWVVQVKDVYGIEAINLSLGAAGRRVGHRTGGSDRSADGRCD